jgi:hypothetical protein
MHAAFRPQETYLVKLFSREALAARVAGQTGTNASNGSGEYGDKSLDTVMAALHLQRTLLVIGYDGLRSQINEETPA